MRSRLRLRTVCTLLIILLPLSGLAASKPASPMPGKAAQQKFSYAGANYDYLVYTPAKYDEKTSMPALLLIHGAQGRGADMLEVWRKFADEHGIVLVAPTFPLTVKFEDQVPKLLPELMNTVARTWNVDPQRRYVFGYSAGGYSTFAAATLASDYFAGAAVFACIITPDYDHIVDGVTRKTPIALYIGDRNPSFPLSKVRRTRDLLVAHGFPVRYVEIKGQDHNYWVASAWVNADAWTFLSAFKLPEHPAEK